MEAGGAAAFGLEQMDEADGTRVDAQVEPDALNAKVARLVAKHGPAFKAPYGWAAEALDSRAPTFRDIEAWTHMSRWRRFYKLSSGNVHSSPRATYNPLELLDGSPEVLLSGFSNSGLSTPGQLAANSLLLTTQVVMNLRPMADGIVAALALDIICDELQQEFARVEQEQILKR